MTTPRTWIALLRGVNVGTANRLAMADLRRVVESLGCSDVRTMLNSGNVVFTAAGDEAGLATGIERAIAGELDLRVRVLVRSATALAAVIEANPFVVGGLAQKELAVAFLDTEPPATAWKAFDTDAYLPDRWARGERCVYLYQPNGFSGSKLPDLGKVLGAVPTARNWATTTKLAALAAG